MKISPEDRITLKEALFFMQILEPEPEHVRQVRRLGVILWNQTQKLHQLPPRARLLFEAAALLHDCGWRRAPDGRAHHKHSAAIIREQPWKSISALEVRIVAQIARYHRKSLPKLRHTAFASLPAPARRMVQANAALLRLADSLDRSHRQPVCDLHMEETKTGWILTVLTTKRLHSERHSFEKKKDLFEQYFKTSVHMVCLKQSPRASNQVFS